MELRPSLIKENPLHDRFISAVQTEILPKLCELVVLGKESHPRYSDASEVLKLAKHDFILLLFLALAERSQILPMWNEKYQKMSLHSLLERVSGLGKNSKSKMHLDLGNSLKALVSQVNQGNAALDLPAYSLTLFSDSVFMSLNPSGEIERLLYDILVAFSRVINTDGGFPLVFENSIDSPCPKEGSQAHISISESFPEILGLIYERSLCWTLSISKSAPKFIIEDEQEKKGGEYYTPLYIREYMFQNALTDLEFPSAYSDAQKQIDKFPSILDPAMGCGFFLMTALNELTSCLTQFLFAKELAALTSAELEVFLKYLGCKTISPSPSIFIPVICHSKRWIKRILAEHCLHGVDIDPTAVEIGKLALLLLTTPAKAPPLNFNQNLRVGNTLIGTITKAKQSSIKESGLEQHQPFHWKQEFPQHFPKNDAGFDLVIGNPPYGIKFEKNLKEILKDQYASPVRYSSALFVERSIDLSRQVISLIVPKTIAFYKSWRNIRHYIFDNTSVRRIADVGIAFNEVNLEQLILFLQKPRLASSYNVKIDRFNSPKKYLPEKTLIHAGSLPSILLEGNRRILFSSYSREESQILQELLDCSIPLSAFTPLAKRCLYLPNKDKASLLSPPYLIRPKPTADKIIYINKVPDVQFYYIKRYYLIPEERLQQYGTKLARIRGKKLLFKVLRGNRLRCYPDLSGDLIPTEKLVMLRLNSAKYSLLFLTAVINSRIPSWILQRTMFSKVTETSRVLDKYYLQEVRLPLIDFSKPPQLSFAEYTELLQNPASVIQFCRLFRENRANSHDLHEIIGLLANLLLNKGEYLY